MSSSKPAARRAILLALALYAGLGAPGAALADTSMGYGDLDIFLGRSGGTANAANVMILIDNSSNWSRQSQSWGVDASGTKLNQGQAEVNAIKQAITFLESQGQPINIGLSLLTPYNLSTSTGGGYIRFGARNMADAGSSGNYPNATALQNILSAIYQNTNGGGSLNEVCCGMKHKDETAAFYELYKYFSGLTPYTGAPNSQNTWVDYSGNVTGNGLTAADQGLTSGFAIAQGNGGWQYQSPITTANPCAANYIIYVANNSMGNVGSTENVYEPSVVPALTKLPPTSTDTWTDEWTRYLYQSGVVVPSGNNNGRVVTYILDAYDAQNDAGYSASLKSAAMQGGGRYFQVGSAAAVYNAIVDVLSQIEAVNSTFSSAALPVNSTNRSIDNNQVFVPMFRPDANDQPRWMGNLKEYQIIIDSSGNLELGDANGNPALNPLTGFPDPCALSFWTSDSTDITHYPNGYWSYGESINAAGNWNTVMESSYTKGTCGSSALGPYTDDPDGPIVEKGGVAEVVRKGDNPPTTNGTPTWSPSARNILTLKGLTSLNLVAFNQSNTGLPADLVNWVIGYDVEDENGNTKTTTESRPSLHGDSIHSQPLAVDYGSGNTVVFYGSNDGTLRAVDGSTGKELWAFVAPEFYTPAPTAYVPANSSTGTAETPPTGLARLMWSGMTDPTGGQISPLIKYFDMATTNVSPAPRPKNYYFDGSTGLYEGALNSNGVPSPVWIYPAMRRGGRMIYAMDVGTPGSPQVKWKFGCPSLSNDSGCTSNGSDTAAIGQTWSTPAVAASLLGHSGPVVVVGGGYDACEDENTATPDCTANSRVEKGAGVYVIDADTGQELAFFATQRSVPGDVSLISITTVGVVDHAYAADTGGNVYRIDFGSSGPSTWTMHRVAYTNGAGRKFLYAPALLAAPGNQVYVALGSGDREHPLAAEYPYSVLNRFYVFKDSLTTTSTTLNLDCSADAASASNPACTTAQMDDFTSGTNCSTAGVLPDSAMSGWFMSLNQNGAGEQTVTSAVIASGMLAFSTNRSVPASQGTCSTLLGVAYGYWVDLFNASGGVGVSGATCGGTRSVPFIGEGLPGSPQTADVTVNGRVYDVIFGAAPPDGAGTGSGTGTPGCIASAINACQVPLRIVPKRSLIYWKSSGTD